MAFFILREFGSNRPIHFRFLVAILKASTPNVSNLFRSSKTTAQVKTFTFCSCFGLLPINGSNNVPNSTCCVLKLLGNSATNEKQLHAAPNLVEIG
jgi:heterodisulfide reductase subunit A-like polyferredoxin